MSAPVALCAGLTRKAIGAGIVLLFLSTACANPRNIAPEAFRAGASYATQFLAAENPVSEQGMWTTGKARGFDWADIAVIPGLAYGVEAGTGGYDDATALLTGTWKPDQMAEATVHAVAQNDNIYEEVELRLRSSLSAHRSTGYEINFRCSRTENAYAEIVRWDGPVGKFTYLTRGRGSKYGVGDGDVVTATAVGSLITAYINGVQVLQARDSSFATGSPGMGFFLQGATGVNRDYGFRSFRAWNAPDATSNVGSKRVLSRRTNVAQGISALRGDATGCCR